MCSQQSALYGWCVCVTVVHLVFTLRLEKRQRGPGDDLSDRQNMTMRCQTCRISNFSPCDVGEDHASEHTMVNIG